MKIICGIGNKARNGKDVLAKFISEKRKNVHIIHFADELYNQIKNSQLEFPIAIKCEDTYFVKDRFFDNTSYQKYQNFEVQALEKIFENQSISNQIITKNNIKELWRMIDKEPHLLQFWGTDYRRKMCDENETREVMKNPFLMGRLIKTMNNRMGIVSSTRALVN